MNSEPKDYVALMQRAERVERERDELVELLKFQILPLLEQLAEAADQNHFSELANRISVALRSMERMPPTDEVDSAPSDISLTHS